MLGHRLDRIGQQQADALEFPATAKPMIATKAQTPDPLNTHVASADGDCGRQHDGAQIDTECPVFIASKPEA